MRLKIFSLFVLSAFAHSLHAQNVGINQNNPTSTLDINGNINVGSSYSGVNIAPVDGAIIEGATGIGTATPHSSAMLDISSTAKGVLVPRMTTAQRNAISSPSDALLVFDTTTGSFWFFDGNGWVELVSSATDSDAQTLSIAADSLEISAGNKVDLSTYLDNTDNQDLSLTGNNLTLTNDGSPVDLSIYLDNTDSQTLTFNDPNLSISSGNSVDLSSLSSDDGDWTVAGADMFNANSGDVGIGTETPNAQLHLAKSGSGSTLQIETAVNGGLSGGSVANFRRAQGTLTTPLNAPISVGSTYGSLGDLGAIQWQGLKDGSFRNAAAIVGRTRATSPNVVRGEIAFWTSTASAGGMEERMRITSDGELGIGTTSPAAKLHVAGGDAHLDDNLYIGQSSDTDDDIIYFDQSAERLSWDEANHRFEFTDDVHSYNGISTDNRFFGRINAEDTRDTNLPPSNFDKEVHFEFKRRTAIGVPGSGTYGGLMTFAPWSDNSGNAHHQLNFNEGGIYHRTGQPDAASWDSWDQLMTESAGDLNYIQNQTATDQTAGFRVSGDGLVGGNMGIGTSTPGAKLEVAGQIKITGGAPGAGKVLKSDANGLATWETPSFDDTDWVEASGEVYRATGNVGIGNTDPIVKLHVDEAITKTQIWHRNTTAASTANTVSWHQIVQSDAFNRSALEIESGLSDISDPARTSIVKFKTSDAGNDGTTMAFDGNDVVIGGTTASAKLDVISNEPSEVLSVTKPSGVASGDVVFIGSGESSVANMLSIKDGSSYTNDIMTVKSNNGADFGQVGLGTDAPGSHLHLKGDDPDIFLDINSSSPNNLVETRYGVDGSILATSYFSKADSSMVLENRSTGAVHRIALTKDGNVGIGTTSPDAKLEVAGQLKITGGAPGANKVLTSDANGLATWVDPSTNGDDLGNHIAEIDIDMEGNNVEDWQDLRSTVDASRPAIVLNSSGSGDQWTSQGAYVSIGESGELGSAAAHFTYRGDGYGFIGAGTVTNGEPGGSYWRFQYNADRIYTPDNVGIGTTAPATQLHVNGSAATVRVDNSSIGQSSITRTIGGLELITGGMNTTSKYGSAVKFMSDDSELTTESPKLLAAIVPRATEAYSLDTKGGMAIDFATTPNTPGTTSVPSVRMTIDSDGEVGIGTSAPRSTLDVNGPSILGYHGDDARIYITPGDLTMQDNGGTDAWLEDAATSGCSCGGDGCASYGGSLNVEFGDDVYLLKHIPRGYQVTGWIFYFDNPPDDLILRECGIQSPNCTSLYTQVSPSNTSNITLASNQYVPGGGEEYLSIQFASDDSGCNSGGNRMVFNGGYLKIAKCTTGCGL